MKNYERITKRDKNGKISVPLMNAYYIMQAYERLAELEDKLENGELGNTKEIASAILSYLYEKLGNSALSDTELVKALAIQYGVVLEQ